MGALDTLLAPIALYPDPLIALILPASTVPGDVSAAAAFLVQYADPTQIDGQPWDPSVKALAHYPTVIAWMADNMDWTEALGSAFQSSPSDVMESIQGLRARASASGALTSTPQQQVFPADGAIEIIPAQPDVIYVPAYDPDVVYSDVPYSGYGGPFFNFGSPYPAGAWLSFCFDWNNHSVWVAGPNAWRGPGGWHRPPFEGGRAPQGARPWHAPANAPRAPSAGPGGRGHSVPQPRPMPGAPNPPPAHFRKPNVSTVPQRGGAEPSKPVVGAEPSSENRAGSPREGGTPPSRDVQPPGNASRPGDAEPHRGGSEAPRPAPPETKAPSNGSPAHEKDSAPPAHAAPAREAPAEPAHPSAPASTAPDSKDREPAR
jgi:hypothetical protein